MSAFLTVHRAEMAAALAAVTGAIAKRNTIPILANVLIRSAGGIGITVTASNLDIEITAPCQAVEAAAFAPFTVAGRTLEDIVRKLPEDAEIGFSGEPAKEVTISSGRSRFRLNTLPESDFPTMAAADLPHSLSLSAGELVTTFSAVQFAISTEETRYYLNGIYLHPQEKDGATGIVAVATDGHRLAFRRIEQEAWSAEGTTGTKESLPAFAGVIVPRPTVALVLKLAGKLKIETPISVALSESRIDFDFGTVKLTSKLIDGTFPDYPRVIPQANPNKSRFSVAALTAALDRASTVAGERGRAVKMAWGETDLTLAVSDPDQGQSEDAVAVEHLEGDSVEIGFNAKYALEMLAHISTENGEAELGDPGSPAVFRPAGDATTLFVLMPMRV